MGTGPHSAWSRHEVGSVQPASRTDRHASGPRLLAGLWGSGAPGSLSRGLARPTPLVEYPFISVEMGENETYSGFLKKTISPNIL